MKKAQKAQKIELNVWTLLWLLCTIPGLEVSFVFVTKTVIFLANFAYVSLSVVIRVTPSTFTEVLYVTMKKGSVVLFWL